MQDILDMKKKQIVQKYIKNKKFRNPAPNLAEILTQKFLG